MNILFKSFCVLLLLLPKIASALSFVPEGYVLRWEDDFDGPQINTTNWVVARYYNRGNERILYLCKTLTLSSRDLI